MELEVHNKAFVETILSKVRAHRHIVQKYLDGEIAAEEEVPSSQDSAASAVQADGRVEKKKLTQSQKRLAKAIGKQMKIAMAASQAADDAALEACAEEAIANKILFASGPPGTGKTHVVHEQVRRWKRQGARILFALPTGQLASEMRSLHPDVDVDTSHSAFLPHRPPQEAMAILTQYDFVIVDEARRDVPYCIGSVFLFLACRYKLVIVKVTFFFAFRCPC